jgi:hypothetical protein
MRTLLTSAAGASMSTATPSFILGNRHNVFERGGLWSGPAILRQPFEMKGERFGRHFSRLVQIAACADDVGKI